MADIYSIDMLKRSIKRLYETNPHIHINVNLTNPKTHLENVPATIKGVYPNIFTITENSNGQEHSHTLMYTDVLIGQIEIIELKKH